MLQFFRFRILFAVAVILFAMTAVYGALHTTQGVHSVAMGESPLDPGAFRAPIVDVEAILFSPAPLSMEARVRLGRAIDVLRTGLEQRGGTEMAQYSSRELKTLAGMARGLGNLEGDALERVRNNWMRIRSNTFGGDAAWYRFSENDPVPPREEPKLVLSEADRARLERVGSVLDRLDEAIARGTRECERLGEQEPGMADDRGGALARAWGDWSEGWKVEMEHLRDALPEAPAADAPASVRFVHAAADRALRELEAIPNDGRGRWRVPYRQEWERRFRNAAKQVRDARFWTDRAGRGLGV